jgi:hypothetical protein
MRPGIEALNNLPELVKKNIIERYKSIDLYYVEILCNRLNDYRLYHPKTSEFEMLKEKLTEEYYNFASELEQWGVNDGTDVLQVITDDFSERRITKNIKHRFAEIGVSKEQTQKWIIEHLGTDIED